MRRRRGLTWSDLVVVMLLLTLTATFALAQAQNLDEVARRVKCAANLRIIGMALLLYSNDNRGAYPRTRASHADPTPLWGTPYGDADAKPGPLEPEKASPYDAKTSAALPKPNDVTAALFMLLRTQDITSEIFVCPSTGSEKWTYGGGANTPMNWSNWPGRKVIAEHLNYSYQNPYPTAAAIGNGFRLNNAINGEFPVSADMNPGVDALLKLTPASPADAMRAGNSPNHGGEGQNVLFGDGRVTWNVTPFVGVKGDNLYTFGDSGTGVKDKGGDGIVGSPVGPDDAILLPTAKELGLVDAQGKLSESAQNRRTGITEDMKPATPDQQQASRAKLLGTYVRAGGGRKVTLQITEGKFTGSNGQRTVSCDYKISHVGKDTSRLALASPEVGGESYVKINLSRDGSLEIHGNSLFVGLWTKQ